MTASPQDGPAARARTKRRFAPVVWGASALAAATLVLGVTGTLSSWTTAIVTNDTDTVASVPAVSLKESSGGTTCVDTAATADNTAVCQGVNKYGGTSTALDPDDPRVQVTTVRLENTGTAAGDLTLGAGACASSAFPAGTVGSDPTAYPLCTQVLVALECTGDLTATHPAVSLTTFAAEDPDRALGSLAATETTDCTFTLSLPATTPAGYASQVASQVLTWTLTA